MHRFVTRSLLSPTQFLPREVVVVFRFSHSRRLYASPLQCDPTAKKYFIQPHPKSMKFISKVTKRSNYLNISSNEDNQLHITWWIEKMQMCKKPSAIQLIKRLVYSNLLGLDDSLKNGSLKEGTLNFDILQFKSRFPREVLLCRVGDFYEAIGFDACILVEHAGLNPFGGMRSDSIPKAGCPVVVHELYFHVSWLSFF
ncbi:hypothetical protein ZOSMA_35G00730 [Zostera marina]|uniref:DNA mismatch repair protein MutS-like N-terminal domain-containing protein n=1 Tax=Zostera marina TaxID=29655 RepID=A0A0K9P6I3_ZOSMR|nr:hypothetical protein ZOSMA_35G00730 [Zostera marina]